MSCREVMEAVILALDEPRTRFGALEYTSVLHGEPLRHLAITLGTPGAKDRIDQAVNVMRAFLKTEESS